MLDKLEQIDTRYEELTNETCPRQSCSRTRLPTVKPPKQHRSLGEVVQKFQSWKALKGRVGRARRTCLTLPTTTKCARWPDWNSKASKLSSTKSRSSFRLLLIPSDPNDEKNVILEIRAGTGGDEATLFAAEMLRMYARYAEKQRWKIRDPGSV